MTQALAAGYSPLPPKSSSQTLVGSPSSAPSGRRRNRRAGPSRCGCSATTPAAAPGSSCRCGGRRSTWSGNRPRGPDGGFPAPDRAGPPGSSPEHHEVLLGVARASGRTPQSPRGGRGLSCSPRWCRRRWPKTTARGRCGSSRPTSVSRGRSSRGHRAGPELPFPPEQSHVPRLRHEGLAGRRALDRHREPRRVRGLPEREDHEARAPGPLGTFVSRMYKPTHGPRCWPPISSGCLARCASPYTTNARPRVPDPSGSRRSVSRNRPHERLVRRLVRPPARR